MYVCMYVYNMYVCMYLCMYVCMYVYNMYVWMVCMYACMQACKVYILQYFCTHYQWRTQHFSTVRRGGVGLKIINYTQLSQLTSLSLKNKTGAFSIHTD